jgi:cell division topological specificity factor
MNLFGLFKRRESAPSTAPVARERLEILLAHERKSSGQPNLLGLLKDDILAAIARHMAVGPDAVKVRIERKNNASILRIAVDVPSQGKLIKAA